MNGTATTLVMWMAPLIIFKDMLWCYCTIKKQWNLKKSIYIAKSGNRWQPIYTMCWGWVRDWLKESRVRIGSKFIIFLKKWLVMDVFIENNSDLFHTKVVGSQLQKFHQDFYFNPKTDTETNVNNLSVYHGTDLRTPLS